MAREYIENVVLNRNGIKAAKEVQKAVKNKGLDLNDYSALERAIAGIGGAASILSLVFAASTPASLALGITSVATSLMGTSERAAVINMARVGLEYLNEVEDFMDANPRYDQVKVNLPFLDYTDKNVRFVAGTGNITAVHSGNGWIISR